MHQLPDFIVEYTEKETKRFTTAQLLKAREKITSSYRDSTNLEKQKFKSAVISSEVDVTAYLISRLPVIYQVIYSLLQNISDKNTISLLDIGSGPGTATYAAREVFPSLEKITMLEKNQALSKAAKAICHNSGSSVLRETKWLEQDLNQVSFNENYDLIIVSYVLNELTADQQISLVNRLWNNCSDFLLLVEPGTPEGFVNIRRVRDLLINLGAKIAAPCPEEQSCPIKDPDWCHFSKRVERTQIARYLKQGTEAYEDEKFSYILLSRESFSKAGSRVVRHPFYHKGFVELSLCDGKEINKVLVSKKEGEKYKLARKVSWGESF